MEQTNVTTGVPAADAMAELERILGDPAFDATEKQRSLLRYLCEKTLAGWDEARVALGAAVEVFGRPASAIADDDPIVRIETARLRVRLAQFYALNGWEGTLIELPRTRPLPIFTPGESASLSSGKCKVSRPVRRPGQDA
ncbi:MULTISPECIES: hypothetical protein [Hyphomicrobiales]|uniref:Uncharacterized protein n=1 Tax=Bradyrhizobium lupini HPC(L) TaxID=1229491 RepID=A0ABN0HK74_RHILU|nr:hypothetical protein [Agrobacterium pusense]EKJ95046.1 hypothetical protein C241_14818 [Bradyrhizobium lupini HPC(L)]OOO19702.1 hypothetical protein BTE56_13340 [Agrobacterium pusense]WKD47929.1 hypothetical protein M8C82_25510 [Agrobacterium pusense]SDF63810.1 hypothetical protein SAMN05421750_12023 [Agrobacterium pusense]